MKRGFSLVECLLTMFLMMVVLSVATQLMSSYSQVMRQSAGHERTIYAAMVGLDRIGSELSESDTVSSPASGALVSLVEFRKLDPSLTRLPTPPSSAPVGWKPHDPAYEVLVRYRSDGTDLLREVVTGGTTRTLVVCRKVKGLSTRRTSAGNVEVMLSVDEGQRIRSLSTEVFLLSGR